MENFSSIFKSCKKILKNIRGYLDKENIKSKLKELEKIILDEKFWKDQNLVKKLLSKKF